MVADPKKFYGGVGLMVGFIVVLIVMFMPIFNGMNLLDYMDSLYNSISKGSAYYVAGLKEENETRKGIEIDVSLDLHDESQAAGTALLLEAGGASVMADGKRLAVKGDLGEILGRCLEDSDEMFVNNGSSVRGRYGYDEKRVMFNWWTALKAMDKDLKKQKRFAEAAFIVSVKKKAVECAYNYYGVEPQRITERFGVVVFSLIFYVLYTVWYGFAIIYMFEGWGLKLSH